MKNLPNVTDSTLRAWRKRQNIFLLVIVASFVMFGVMTMTSSNAQTPPSQSPTPGKL